MGKIRLDPEEEAFFTELRVTQLKVGVLEISTQTSNLLGQNNFYYGVSVFKADGTPGWGKPIFEGTLKELVDFIDKANQCLMIKEGNQCHSEKS